MILIDDCNRKIKQGDSYFIITVYDEYHFPINDYRIFKYTSDLNRFVKYIEEVAPGYSVISRKAVYSGSGWGI